MSKCPKCGSEYFEVREDDTCLSCGWQRNTVFDRITASPEVLAEKLVYHIILTDCMNRNRGYWRSTFFPCNKYLTKEKAIAATVAKLKEVEK